MFKLKDNCVEGIEIEGFEFSKKVREGYYREVEVVEDELDVLTFVKIVEDEDGFGIEILKYEWLPGVILRRGIYSGDTLEEVLKFID